MTVRGASSLLTALSLLLLAACKSTPQLTTDDVTATPAMMEVVGGRVPVVINGRVPEKFMQPNAVLTLTPRLVYGASDTPLTLSPVRFRGEKVDGTEQEMPFATGGNFSIRTGFPYDTAMQQARLYLDVTLKEGKDAPKMLPSLHIGRGTVATSTLASRTLRTLSGTPVRGTYYKRLMEGRTRSLRQLLKEVNLRNSVLSAMQTADFVRTLDNIDIDQATTRLAPLSPSALYFDGALKSTDAEEHRLLSASASTIARLEATAAADTLLTRADWQDFTALVEMGNLAVRDSLLEALTTYVAPSERDEHLRRFRERYDTLLRATMPRLKRFRSLAIYDITGRSESELLAVARKKPAALSVEDLLLSAALLDDAEEKQACYEAALRRAPKDYRAPNNLCCLAIDRGDYATAEAYADKALLQNDKSAEVNANKALLRLLSGDETGALAFISADDTTANAQLLRGALSLLHGDYRSAVKLTAGSISNVAALAQLLTRDYRAATATLRSILNPDATTFYLKAVTAARAGRAARIAPNLTEALSADPSLRPYALHDAEFSRYAGRNDVQKALTQP